MVFGLHIHNPTISVFVVISVPQASSVCGESGDTESESDKAHTTYQQKASPRSRNCEKGARMQQDRLFEKGWLEQEFKEARENVEAWPRWKRRVAGLESGEGGRTSSDHASEDESAQELEADQST